MPNVERRDLSSDLSISRVLTGLWQLADMERDGRRLDLDRAAAAMRPYVDAGLTTFDMADHYGPAEEVAGLFRSRAPHQPVQLFTKWVPKPGRVSKTEVRAAVERALTRLGVEAIDLLQYHAWNYADPSWLETLFDLQELRTRGLIRQLGLTNFDTAHLRVAVASGIDVVSNQVSFSLLDQRAAGGLGPFCAGHGVRLLAYGTLAGGWLTERWLDAPEPDWERLSTWSQMKYGRFLRIAGGWSALQRVLKAAASVAVRHGVSIANVASRFILDQPGVAGVIIGARLGEREHIDDTLRIFSLVLSDDDRSEIRAALATLQPIPGDCGDEYRKPPFLTATGDLSHHLDSMPAPYQAVPRDRGRTLCLTGTTWESVAGFARAVRQGRRVFVSGTTATMGDRVIGGSDPAAQAHFVIDKIEGALQSLGATLADVVRTRVYVRNIADWEPVARAHGARFGAIQPANTLVGAALVGDEYLVEIEAEADVASVSPRGRRLAGAEEYLMQTSNERALDACNVVRQHFPPSRLVRADSISSRVGADVFLKLESELPTGSFKVRGALYALFVNIQRRSIDEVVASSTGNHGAAVAYAARRLGVNATIFLPRNPNPVKRDKIAALGARVIEHGVDLAEAFEGADEHATKTGAFFLNDATDPDLPAGPGTIADEVFDELAHVDAIYVPVGDTALIRGLGTRAKALRPDVRIIGVQAEQAPAYFLSWRGGSVVSTETADTVADGLATRLPALANVHAIRKVVDDMRLVTDEDMLSSVSLLLTQEHLVVEPAGAAPVAAILKETNAGQPQTVVLVVSGSNIAPNILSRAITL